MENQGRWWPCLEDAVGGVGGSTSYKLYQGNEDDTPALFTTHMVFELPKYVFREDAEGFRDWKDTREVWPWRQLFSLYFEMVERILRDHKAKVNQAKEKDASAAAPQHFQASFSLDTSGSNGISDSELPVTPSRMIVECVFESNDITVDYVSAEAEKVAEVVAYRFHFFDYTDADIGAVLQEILAENEDLHTAIQNKTMRNKRQATLSFQIEPHQFYKHITCDGHYVRQCLAVYTESDEYGRCGPYKNSPYNFETGGRAMPRKAQMAASTTFPGHPLNVFTMETLVRRNTLWRRMGKGRPSRNDLQLDQCAYKANIFPIPDATFELKLEQMSGAYIFARFFPDHQRNVLTKMAGGFTGSSVPVYTETEVDGSLTETQRQRRASAKTPSRSAYMAYGGHLVMINSDLVKVNNSSFERFLSGVKSLGRQPSWSQKGYVESHLALLMDQMEPFKTRICTEDAAASDEAKEIMKYKDNKSIEEESRGQCVVNSFGPGDGSHFFGNMSVFADFALKRMLQYDTLLHVSTAHRLLYMAELGRLDAYRWALELHFNMIFAGPKAVSKSFLLEVLQMLSIPNTVKEHQHSTTASAFVDGPQCDQIRISEEMDSRLTAGKGSRASDPTFVKNEKAFLCSQLRITKTFEKDEDTMVRGNRHIKSKQIGQETACTNDLLSNMDEALRSRYHTQPVDDMKRNLRDISTCKAAMQNHKSENPIKYEKRLEKLIAESRQEQLVFFIFFRMHAASLVRKVSLHAANTIFAAYIAKLNKLGIKETTRHEQRLKMFARLLVIRHAFNCVFRCRGGRWYGAERFREEQALDIEPLLYCTAEMAFFTITLLQDDLVDPTKAKVEAALRKLIDVEFLRDGKYSLEMFPEKSSSNEQAVPDFEYIRFPGTADALASKIRNFIDEEEGIPSVNNIKRVFGYLTKKQRILSKSYSGIDSNNIPTIDSSSPEKSLSIIRDTSVRYIDFHASMFFTPAKERTDACIVRNAIMELQSSSTRTGRYLLGTSLRLEPDKPKMHHLFDFVDLKQTSDTLRVANGRYCSVAVQDLLEADEEERSKMSNKTIACSGFTDDNARIKHHKTLGWDVGPGGKDNEMSKKFSAEYIKEKRIESDRKWFAENGGKHNLRMYPDVFMTEEPAATTSKRKHAASCSPKKTVSC